MFGLDQLISGLGHGGEPAVVLAVAVLLGLRHATDPDHLVAVSTLVATETERRVRKATELGLAWGLGHATTLLLLGLPFLFAAALLPATVQSALEALIGLVIMALATRLSLASRHGAFHAHVHRHDEVVHRHLHPHDDGSGHDHEHRVRSPLQAFGVGLIHGAGGSAGIAMLLLGGIGNRTEAAAALLLFALATAVSMTLLSSGFGLALGLTPLRRRFVRVTPVLATLAFGFGLCYCAAALASL